MSRWMKVGAGVVALTGISVAAWLLLPTTGPARNLALDPDPARGDYLMRLAGCVACHTDITDGGAFMAGGPALESDFGTFFGPNITPDPVHGIGGWSVEDFARAMSDGLAPDGSHYYPAFPYDAYTLMDDQDIVDLYAALMAIDPVATPDVPHEVGFPFSLRFGIAAWKTLYFEPARFEPDPARSAVWNRGAYIVNGPAHCGACHTPRNLIGGPSGPALSGGDAPAITAEALIALGYDREWLEEVLLGGVTPAFDVPGGTMAEVITEGTMHWTDEDITAVATYLLDEE